MFILRPNLYQLGGIQSVSALPDDLTFNQTNNKYDISSYKTVCADLIVDPAADFRFRTVKITPLVMFMSFTVTEVLGR